MKQLPDIYIKIINHSKQAYDTCGDYYTHESGQDFYRISKLKLGWKAELAVLIHEIVEFQLCKEAGIEEQDITKFDVESGLDDPGNSKLAPYHKQHKIAEKIERQIIKGLGLSWKEYDDCINKLKY
jgi:hypothetical protein